MRTLDLNPLYRSFVGIDRVIDLLDAAARADASAPGYPPFNIEDAGDDRYRIELAVAGFTQSELSVDVNDGALIVAGRKAEGDAPRTFLHRGIAERAFERRFRLAEHVEVTSAKLENGLLVIELKRDIPDAKKPRWVAIASPTTSSTLIEGRAA